MNHVYALLPGAAGLQVALAALAAPSDKEEAVAFKVVHPGAMAHGPRTSPNERLTVKVIGSLKLQIIDVESGKEVGPVLEHARVQPRAKVRTRAFSGDGKLLATAVSDGPSDDDEGEVCVWEVATGKLVADGRGGKLAIGCVRAVTFDKDHRTVRIDATIVSGR